MADKPPPHTPVLQKPPNKPPRSPHRPFSHSNITISPPDSPLGALGLINYVPGVSRDPFRTPSPNPSNPLSSELGTPSIRRTMTEPLPFPRRERRVSGDSDEEMGNPPDGLDVRSLPIFPQPRPGWQSFEFMKNLDTGSKRKPKQEGAHRGDTMEIGEDPESSQQEQHASFNSESRSSEDTEPDNTSKAAEQILSTPIPRRRHSSVIPTNAGKRLPKQYGYLNASPIVPSSESKPMSSPSPSRSVPSGLQENEAIDHYNSSEDPPTPTPKTGSSLKDVMLKPKKQQQPIFPPRPPTIPNVPGASTKVQGGRSHTLPSTQLPFTSATTTWAPVTTPYPRILCDAADFDPFKIAVHFTSTTLDGTKLSRPATKAEMETWEKTWKPKYQEFYRRLPESMNKVDRANEAIEMVRLVMEVFEIASERKRKAVIEGAWDPEQAALRDKEMRATIMRDSRVETPMVPSTGLSGGGRKLANMAPEPRMRSGTMASGLQMGPPPTPPTPIPGFKGNDPRAAEAARLRTQITTMYQSRSQVFSGPSGFHKNQFQTSGSTQRQQQNQFNQPLRPSTNRPRSQSMLPPSTNPQQHFSPFALPPAHPHHPQLGVFPPPTPPHFSTRPIITSNNRLDTQPSPRPVMPPKPPTTTTSNLSTAITIFIPDDNDDDNADQSDSDTDSEHEGDGTAMVDIDHQTVPPAAEGDETEDEPLPELELEPVPNTNADEEKMEMEEWIKETFGDGGPGKHVMNLMLGNPDVEMDMGE